MTRSAPNAPSVRRLVLVPASAGATGEPVRRYRLAPRLRLDQREVAAGDRFAHLKRTHD